MEKELDEIASWVAEVRLTDFSSSVISRAKLLLLDFVGCVFAGSTIDESEQAFYLAEPGEYRVAGRPVSGSSAIHAMGVLGALLQYNDGYGNGGNHPSSSILPGLLASGNALNDLVLPMIVGYEISNRLSAATHPRLTRTGFTPTAIWGPVGSAVALCKLAEEPYSCIRQAVAISLFCPPIGLFSYLQEMVSAVPQHHGWAARFGSDAVHLSRAGLNGSDNPLGGQKSLPDLLGVELNFGSPSIELDGETIKTVYTKREIGCRHCHPSAALARALKKSRQVEIEAIESVDISTYKVALGFSKVPDERQELYACLMSIPWIFSANLIFGGVTPHLLTDRFRHPEILRLAKKVQIYESSDAEAHYPLSLNSEVSVKVLGLRESLKLAEVLSYSSESDLFAPESLFDPAFGADELISKFKKNCAGVISEKDTHSLVNLYS